MKLSRAANLSPKSRVKTIFLPSSAHIQINPNEVPTTTSSYEEDLLDRNENYLRKMATNTSSLANLIAQVNQNEIRSRQVSNRAHVRSTDVNTTNIVTIKGKRKKRRNDKYLHRRPTTPDDKYWIERNKFLSNSIDYVDCVAVGWGKYRNSGDLSDVLLKIEVPIQNIKR